MHTNTNAERLYDYEATLRLVDSALDELQILGVELGHGDSYDDFAAADDESDEDESGRNPGRAFREVQEGLNSLRHSRAVLERTSEEKNFPRRSESEVPAVSATDALSGLDRALLLVDRFQEEGAGGSPADTTFDGIRDEIRAAMACLQVHDVTEQQLSYASSILLDMDGRLTQLADLLDPQGFGSNGRHGSGAAAGSLSLAGWKTIM